MTTTDIHNASLAAAPAAPPRARLSGWVSKHTTIVTLPLVLLALEAAVWLFDIPNYVVPAPHDVFHALVAGFSLPLASRAGFYIHIGTTLIEALVSFVLGSVLGIGLGAVVVQFPFVRRLVLPYVVGLQSVPKVALAPLFVVWFGLGLSSKIVLGVLLTFFPVLINTMAGLGSVDRDRIELMMSLGASRWQTFRSVRLPSALPYVFAGLEMAAVYSILGAVVGEFVGGQSGLGVLILNRNASLDIPGAIAALTILAVIGVMLQKAVAFARGRLLFWAPSPNLVRGSGGE